MFSEKRWNVNFGLRTLIKKTDNNGTIKRLVGARNGPTCTSVADQWSCFTEVRERYVLIRSLCRCKSVAFFLAMHKPSTLPMLAKANINLHSKFHCCKTDLRDVRTRCHRYQIIYQFNNVYTAKIWICSAVFTEILVQILSFFKRYKRKQNWKVGIF